MNFIVKVFFFFILLNLHAYERSHMYSKQQKAFYKALFPLAWTFLLLVTWIEFYAFCLLNVLFISFSSPLMSCWLTRFSERCIYLHKLCCRVEFCCPEMIYQNVLLTWQWNRTLVLFDSMCYSIFLIGCLIGLYYPSITYMVAK